MLLGAVPAVVATHSVTLVTFDGAADTTHRFVELNDPVMGGRSNGTWTVMDGYGVFDGNVNIVPSLQAPGFIEAWANDKHFVDASAVGKDGALVLTVRSDTPEYTGFRLSVVSGAKNPSFSCATGGAYGARGCYKSQFTVPASSDGAWTKVRIPFENFSDKWSAATGEPTKTCAQDPTCCLTAAKLQKIQALGFWGEGKLGRVHLEVKSVSAESAPARPPAAYDECSGPVQAGLRYNVSALGLEYFTAPVAVNPDESLAAAVCCDKRTTPYAEPQFLYQNPSVALYQRMATSGPTTFYDSVCGLPLFRAPMGRSLAAFKRDTDEHGWPSFRKKEVVDPANFRVDQATGFVFSKCGTHLGSYLPDERGDRYCLDISCIAGNPPPNSIGTTKEQRKEDLSTKRQVDTWHGRFNKYVRGHPAPALPQRG